MINIIPNIPKDIKEEINYQKDSIISKIIFKSDNFSITLFAIADGQEISPHTTTSKAIIHILEGDGEFMLSDKWHKFKENDYFFMKENLKHAIRANSDSKFLLYLVE